VRLRIYQHLPHIDGHPCCWARLPAVRRPFLRQLVSDRQGHLHALWQLLRVVASQRPR
jgi:hypothetical protein